MTRAEGLWMKWLVCLGIWLGLPLSAWAQVSTPSHRFIPLAPKDKPPSFEDFVTPELLELKRAYDDELRRRRGGRSRAATEQNRVAPVPRDLRQEDLGLIEQIDNSLRQSMSDDLAEETSRLSDRLARELGGHVGESLRQEIEFDSGPPIEIPKSFDDLGRAYRDVRNNVRQQYRNAVRQYHRSWPQDSMPIRDWIKKVQPLIHPEVAKQLADAAQRQQVTSSDSRPERGSSSDEAQASPATSSPIEQKKTGTATRGLLDSVIGTIDKRGADWLKSANRKRGKRSWLKSMTAETKNRLVKLNRSITARSRRLSRDRALALPSPLSGGTAGRAALPSVSRRVLAGLIGLLVAVVGLAVFLRYFGAKRGLRTEPECFDSDGIHDRETLLRACHWLAITCFGLPSRFWHHRQVFSRLRTRARGQAQAVDQLAEIYERARYAPQGWLSADDIASARQLFAQVQDVSAVVA